MLKHDIEIKSDCLFKNKEIKDLFRTEVMIENFRRGDLYKYEQVLKERVLLKIIVNKNLVETILCFLNNGLNLTHASEGSYVHRNTMIYRIKKLDSSLGLDVKNFNDAVIFVNVLLAYEKLGIIKS